MTKPTPYLRVTTYNSGRGTVKARLADFRELAHTPWPTRNARGARIIDAQEMSAKADKKVIRLFLDAEPDWGLWSGDGRPGAAAVPILYNLDGGCLTGAWSHTATGRTWVGGLGAGPPWVKAKVLNRIRVEDPDFGRVHNMNGHNVTSVVRAHLANNEKRRQIYRKQTTLEVHTTAPRNGIVTLAGDKNAPPPFDLLRPLKQAGLVQLVDEPTRHDSIIDHIYLRQPVNRRSPHRVVVVDVRVFKGFTSDHRPAEATFRKAN